MKQTVVEGITEITEMFYNKKMIFPEVGEVTISEKTPVFFSKPWQKIFIVDHMYNKIILPPTSENESFYNLVKEKAEKKVLTNAQIFNILLERANAKSVIPLLITPKNSPLCVISHIIPVCPSCFYRFAFLNGNSTSGFCHSCGQRLSWEKYNKTAVLDG